MRKNVYKPAEMKSAATRIGKELVTFNRCKNEIDHIIVNLSNNWDDDECKTYTKRYRNKMKPLIDQLSRDLERMEYLLEQCSKRYGSAIDNGNSYLSE